MAENPSTRSAESRPKTAIGARPVGATPAAPPAEATSDALPAEATPGALPTIHVAAVALLRERRVLMVTARARDVLYLPGGKIDPGETSAEALVRECREEIAVELDGPSIRHLFTVTEQAHGEPDGRMVAMTLFHATTLDEPTPSAEVDSVHWVTSQSAARCPPAGVETLARLRELDLID